MLLICDFLIFFFFFFNDTATTEIYTLSLHDALPISSVGLVERAGRVPADRLRVDRAVIGHVDPPARHARVRAVPDGHLELVGDDAVLVRAVRLVRQELLLGLELRARERDPAVGPLGGGGVRAGRRDRRRKARTERAVQAAVREAEVVEVAVGLDEHAE